MKILATRRMLTAYSVLVAFLCLVIYGLDRIAAAESKLPSQASSEVETILAVSDNVIPDTPVKMKFLRGVVSKERADRDQLAGERGTQLTPLSLATGDLNADGLPDLITGYGTSDGGLLIVRYGSEQAFAPSDPAEIAAIVENRFPNPFSGRSVIRLDHAPDFLFTGDFDRDSRMDILTAAKNGIEMQVQRSDGQGFTRETIDLPGQLSTVAVSSAYTADGFADVYAGIAGGQLLAYERSESVLDQEPDVYQLPGTPNALALGRFDGGTTADFAAVVSGGLYVIRGGGKTYTERVDLPFAARSIAAADFIWDRDGRMEIAVAADDGTTSILSRGELDTTPFTSDELRSRRRLMVDVREGRRPAPVVSENAAPGMWRIAEQTSIDADLRSSDSQVLIPMLASGQQSVDLLAVGRSALGISYRTDGLSPAFDKVSRQSVSFPTTQEPVAAVAMRLNVHASPSIVVLGKDNPEPEFLFFAPEATFTVSKTADTNDGTCNADCSLREAVAAANAAVGADTVAFAAGLNGLPIQLTRVGDDNTNVNGDLDINSDISIVGNGTANTIIQGSSTATFTGNMGDKAIGVNQSGAFTTLNFSLSSLTVRFTRNDITTNAGFTQTGGAMDIFLTGGGAVPGPTSTITTVIFDSNASLHSYGGALNIDSGAGVGPTGTYRGTVQITGSTFSNNDTLTTTDDALNDSPHGGAINMFSDRHDVTISSSSITGNQTSALITANGGGINMRHSFGGTITLNGNTNITNNIAGSDGGGILTAFNQTLSITGGSISGNTAQGTGDSGTGGGFFNANNTLSTTLSGVTISNNVATAGAAGTGGGVADGANVPINLTSCIITGNSADNGGGLAVISSGGTQTMTVASSGTFSGNTATNGSAAYISAGIMVLSGTNTISGNIDMVTNPTAALTAAVGSTTNLTGNLTVGNGTFTGNNSIWNITGNYSQSGGTFNANTGNYGITGSFTQSSGIFNMNTATLGVGSGLTFSGATFNGGGTVNVTGALTISGGTFTSNTGNYTITGSFAQSNGIFSGNTSTWNVSSGSTVSGGTFNGGGTFNVTGTHTISGGTFNAGGTLTISGVGNFTQTAGAFNGGSAVVNLTGNFSFSGAGSFAAGTGTFNFNGGGAQSISSTAVIGFNNISDVNASQPLVFNNSVNVGGTLTANGVNTILQPVAAAVIGGTGSLTGTGTVRVTRATGTDDFFTQYTMPTKTLTNLLVDYVGAAPQGISGTTYTNIRLNNPSGGTLSAPATVNGTLTLAAGAFNVGTSTLTLNSVITSTGGTLTSGATGTVNYNQSSNGQVVLAGQYGNLTFSGFNKVLPASGTVFISGTFTPGAAVGHTITGSTIDFNGTGAQTIPAFNYNNLTISGARGATNVTLVNGGTIGIAGTFNPAATFAGGNYVVTNNTINFNGSGGQTIPAFNYNNLTSSNTGARILANAGIIRIAGIFTPGTNVYTITGSTVEFNGAAAQTLPPTFTTYNNLTLNNPTTVLGFAGLTVQGLLRVQAGTFTSSSTYNNVQIDVGATLAGTNATTINVTGNWTNNGTFTANTNTVVFNGSAPQAIGGTSSTTFNNLTINNATGVTVNTNATVNGVFTLLNGEVATGANTLTLGNAATVIHTSGHVVGNLRKNFAAPGPAFEMPVGTPGTYSPLSVTVTVGSGQLTAKVTTGVPAALVPIQARTLQRYWTLSGSGIRSNLTFNYVDGDVPPPPNNENIWNVIRVTGAIAVRYPPTLPYIFMNPAGNQFTINDLDSYSDWTAGEPLAPTAANASVSGRVIGLDGRGVYGAMVVMQDQSGIVYRTRSNAFGYYTFAVPSGQTYLMSAAYKEYQFEPRTLNVGGDLTDIDFVAASGLSGSNERPSGP